MSQRWSAAWWAAVVILSRLFCLYRLFSWKESAVIFFSCPGKRGWPALILYKQWDRAKHQCCLTPATTWWVPSSTWWSSEKCVGIFMRAESTEFSQRLQTVGAGCQIRSYWNCTKQFSRCRCAVAWSVSLRDRIETCSKMSTQPSWSLSVIKIFSKKVFWQPFLNEVIVQ